MTHPTNETDRHTADASTENLLIRVAETGEDDAGNRLDVVAAQRFPEYSRSQLAQWIRLGDLRLDDAHCRPRDPVRSGQRIELRATEIRQMEDQPEAIRLEIVHEDDALLVVNKPVGLVVHPGAGNAAGTLVNALLHHVPSAAGLPRAGIVHRLDKDTSGLLVVAKTLPAHTALVRMLAAREVHRVYLGWVLGDMIAGGTIDAPIGRHAVDRKRMAVRDGGKPAVTHYRVMARYGGATRLRVELETGRTHQIRVHMASRGFPLIGDAVYGGQARRYPGWEEARREAVRGFRRQALHAHELAFVHPLTGEAMTHVAPVPEDLEALDAALRGEVAGSTSV